MKRVLLALSILCSLKLFAVSYRDSRLKNDSLESLEKLANRKHSKSLLRAINATKAFEKAKNRSGISQRQFLQTAFYIEKFKPKKFIPKKKTKLTHALEFDRKTKKTFIVLNSKKAFLGKGAHKKVYKSILYGKNPTVIARSEQTDKMKSELKALKKLQGAPGLMNTHAFTSHKDKKHHYHTIYSDLYEGTLFSLLYNKQLSFENKLLIMKDLVQGLRSMHAKNLVHRDLHAFNFLIYSKNNMWRAVIADFGQTFKTGKAKKLVSQMKRTLRAPEGINRKKMKGKDYFATDVYALGCIFYNLLHNKTPSWQESYLESESDSFKKKKKKLRKKLKKETKERRKTLIKQRGKLSIEKQAELFVLQMVHHKAAKRPKAAKLYRQITTIINSADFKTK